ncbi:hypothetical protein TNIN_410331 [Trichonephila inaurata madagascariensis]|uniref:Uncharacterized protein n=1 Tax=Trichonephila inaurata madagascariensis TaxID=2747483 RepID=A0A8X6YGH0_9ARAC|nr:hypothetical protein TNIN_410331 [Trichonephila inaurata madagascariensis]
MNEIVQPDSKLIDLRKIITGSENYEKGFVKGLLYMVIKEREKGERETEGEREKAKTEFELEELRLQNFNIKTESNHLNSDTMDMHNERWVSTLRGVGVNDFEKLEDLFITEQLKKGISATTQEHLVDDWSNLINPKELADELDAYENGREEKQKRGYHLQMME